MKELTGRFPLARILRLFYVRFTSGFSVLSCMMLGRNVTVTMTKTEIPSAKPWLLAGILL
jgi:hypothetical protein